MHQEVGYVDLMPHLPRNAWSMSFERGRMQTLGVGRNSRLYISAAGHIEIVPSKNQVFNIMIDRNADQYTAYGAGNALYLFGGAKEQYEKEDTRIIIEAPKDLGILNATLRRRHSMHADDILEMAELDFPYPRSYSHLSSAIKPMLTTLTLDTPSIVRLATQNLFVQSTGPTLARIDMIARQNKHSGKKQIGSLMLFARDGSFIIGGQYYNATMALAGNAVVGNVGVCRGKTKLITANRTLEESLYRSGKGAKTNTEAEIINPNHHLNHSNIQKYYQAMIKGLQTK